MPDLSNLDKKYFIDDKVYNCPFCRRNNVPYEVICVVHFDETDSKNLYAIFIKCNSCNKISMHLSNKNLSISCEPYVNFGYKPIMTDRKYIAYYDSIRIKAADDSELDENIILDIPTSYFTIDSRIPAKIRHLVEEASQCIKNNLMTGASACIRKAIYEFLLEQKRPESNYEDKIKGLKKVYPKIEPEYFDILSSIQGITSDQVHEQSYKSFDSYTAKALLELLKQIFQEVYVLPKELSSKHSEIDKLFSKISEKNKFLQTPDKSNNGNAK